MKTVKIGTRRDKYKFDPKLTEFRKQSFFASPREKFCMAVCTAAISRGKQVASSHLCLFESRIDWLHIRYESGANVDNL